MTICLAFCRTETVLSSITAIPCFNMFPFAVIFCLYWMDPEPLAFCGKFSALFKLCFIKFDVLAVTSPNTLRITSVTIYVKPPQIFFMDRTSPTITLPWNFSIIWRLQRIIICQVSIWGDMLFIPFCDGKICWTVVRVWRWMHPICCSFSFLTQQLPRVWQCLFPRLIFWDECVVWPSKFIGKCYA